MISIYKKNKLALLYPLFILYLLWIQCGLYSFSGSTIPAHIKTVAVPIFDDQTSEYGINQNITNQLIDAITTDNTLKIVTPKNADALLKGIITRVDDRAGQYDSQEQASDFRIYITISITFEDVKKRKTLWEETWTDWGEYTDNRDEGIQEATEKLSEQIINRMVSGW